MNSLSLVSNIGTNNLTMYMGRDGLGEKFRPGKFTIRGVMFYFPPPTLQIYFIIISLLNLLDLSLYYM